jgi:dTDP-4-amino-4,6-dideoxygalactose transaminase
MYWANGPFIDHLEAALAAHLGVEQAIDFNSGTTTLIDPNVGLGIEPTDTVIVPPFSFTATANAV